MKRKLQVLLMAMLLPLFNIKGQDSVSCVHDQFLQEYQDSNLRKGDISKIISYGTKRFREKNPNLQCNLPVFRTGCKYTNIDLILAHFLGNGNKLC